MANPEASSDKGVQPRCIVGKITTTVLEISAIMLFIKMVKCLIKMTFLKDVFFYHLLLAFTPLLRRKMLTVRNFILILSSMCSNKWAVFF
jgi:hypothetical protein